MALEIVPNVRCASAVEEGGLQGCSAGICSSSTGPSWLLVHMVFVEAGVGLVGTEGLRQLGH